MGLEGERPDPALLSLRAETHPDRFASKLFALARNLEGRQGREPARRLYRALVFWRPGSQWGQWAARRQAALSGQGRLEEKFEQIVHGLMPAVTDPANLGGMLAAMGVFRGVTTGVLKFLGQPSLGNRALATLVGFGAEVPGFVLAHRSIGRWVGKVPVGPAPALSEEFYHAALTLGALKVFGLAGTHGLAALGEKAVQSRLLPQGAMFLGVLGAQGLEAKMGLRSFRGGEDFLVQGAATYLHFYLSGAILGPLVPARQAEVRHKLPILQKMPVLLPAEGRVEGDYFPGFFSKALSESSEPSTGAEAGSGIRTKHSSGIRQVGRQRIVDGLKQSLSQFQNTLQYLYMGMTPLETWVQESLSINAQLAREIKTIEQIYAQDDPHSPDLPKLAQLSQGLRDLDLRLREGDIPFMDYSEDLIKSFLRHYYGISNKMINFLDGLEPIEAPLQKVRFSQEALGEILANSEVYKIARAEALPYSVKTEIPGDPLLAQRPPLGPLFNPHRTEAFVRQIQAISGELQKQYFFFDPSSSLESSVEMQGLSQLLREVRVEAKQNHLPRFLLIELAEMQRELSGIIRDLEIQPYDRAALGHESNFSQDVLRELYQLPANLADFLREGELPLLHITRHLARNVRAMLNPSAPGSEAPISR